MFLFLTIYVSQRITVYTFLFIKILTSSYIYTSNNEAIAFENWNNGGGQPNQENNQANCVLVQNHKAQWGDIHCDAKRKYVCEFPDQYSAFYDSVQLDTAVTDAIDMVFEKFFEIKVNTEVDNTLRSPSRRRFLSIGKSNNDYQIDLQ